MRPYTCCYIGGWLPVQRTCGAFMQKIPSEGSKSSILTSYLSDKNRFDVSGKGPSPAFISYQPRTKGSYCTIRRGNFLWNTLNERSITNMLYRKFNFWFNLCWLKAFRLSILSRLGWWVIVKVKSQVEGKYSGIIP